MEKKDNNELEELELDDLGELEDFEELADEEPTPSSSLEDLDSLDDLGEFGEIEELEPIVVEVEELDFEFNSEAEEVDLDIFVGDGFELELSLSEFFEEDDLNSDETATAAITSIHLALPDLEEDGLLALEAPELGEDELDLFGAIEPIEEGKYELVTSPKKHVLAVYKPQKNEVDLVENDMEEIMNDLTNPQQYMNQAFQDVREYLNRPQFDILPKNIRYTSRKRSKEQDFRSTLMSMFLNRQLSEGVSNTGEIIFQEIMTIWRDEKLPELSVDTKFTIKDTIISFIAYGESVYRAAGRSQELATYKPNYDRRIECPEYITNMNYVCKCGGTYSLPNDFPTLALHVVVKNQTAQVKVMNPPVHCPKCDVYLAIPSELVREIRLPASDYVKTLHIDTKTRAVYRPSLEVVESFIPQDAKELFRFETNESQELVDSGNTKNQMLSSYKALTGMWMKQYQYTCEMKEQITSDSQTVAGSKHKSLLDIVARTNFQFDTRARVYQMTKTVLHYLEMFSKFNITQMSTIDYRFYEKEGIDNQSFPKEEAIEWIYKNAPYLASLKNTFDSDLSFKPLYIYPEYIPALNYVIFLYLLSEEASLASGSILKKAITDPSTSYAAVKKLFDKRKLEMPLTPVTSVRDYKSSNKMHPTDAWGDTQTFLANLVYPHYSDTSIDSDLRTLSRRAIRESQEQFYGVAIDKRSLNRPYFMVDDLWKGFKLFGHQLFTGLLVDSKKQNLAILLHNLNDIGLIENQIQLNSKAVNILKSITVTQDEPFNEDVKLFELIIKASELPGEMNEIRDDLGPEHILEKFDEYRDFFTGDAEFMRKYGEVVMCY